MEKQQDTLFTLSSLKVDIYVIFIRIFEMLKTSILPEYDLVFPKNYLSEKKIPPPFFFKESKEI